MICFVLKNAIIYITENVTIETMKAILEFDLPEDVKAFNRASSATDLALALWDVDGYLRGVDKYDLKHDIEKIRESFFEILESYGIILDNIIE